MLTQRLQQVKDRIESKSTYQRTEEEEELLAELMALDELLGRKNLSRDLRESIKGRTQITSGPGGSCPCCGK